MGITLDYNGLQKFVESYSLYTASFTKNWDVNTPPPFGTGIVYAIAHKRVNADPEIAYYIGITRRAAVARWNEHLTEGIQSLTYIIREQAMEGLDEEEQKEKEKIFRNRSYRYASNSKSPLWGAIGIEHGRWINQNFDNIFSFQIIGIFSLLTLNFIESKLIKLSGLGSLNPNDTYKTIRKLPGYNQQDEPDDIPGVAFKFGTPKVKTSFVDRVLALDYFIQHEADGNFDGKTPRYMTKTDDFNLRVQYISKFLFDNKFSGQSKDMPALQKRIATILRIKITLAKDQYILFDGKPYITYTELAKSASSLFSLKGKMHQGKMTLGGLKRIGGMSSLLKPGEGKDSDDYIFKNYNDGLSVTALSNIHTELATNILRVFNSDPKVIEKLQERLIELIKDAYESAASGKNNVYSIDIFKNKMLKVERFVKSNPIILKFYLNYISGKEN